MEHNIRMQHSLKMYS